MKVLFAVNNDDISNAIIKKYQKEYKQILSYKNVYYFNAILKELQKDKTYDRVVISEDLEPFANNNYDTIDKFLFEKLDNISDEAIDAEGSNTDIILICTDRRSKSDEMLTKLFGIGVYNAIIGQDRSIDEVCRLINKPRTKKDAKIYYKIESENVNYQAESEDNVSETEVQNILAHYAKLGKNEDKYVESFDNIVSQYNDKQLKIIIRYLPLRVKAVLEEKSPKYQELANVSGSLKKVAQAKPKLNQYDSKNKKMKLKEAEPFKVKMLESESEKVQKEGPVLIPTGVNKNQVKKLIDESKVKPKIPEPVFEIDDDEDEDDEDIELITVPDEEEIETTPAKEVIATSEEVEPKKRGRGRPRKILTEEEIKEKENKPKRGRGRPRKNVPVEPELEEDEDEDLDLFGLNDDDEKEDEDEELFELNNDEEPEEDEDEDLDLFSINDEDDEEDEVVEEDEDDEDDIDLFGINDDDEEESEEDEADDEEDEDDIDLFGINDDDEEETEEEDEDEDVDLFGINDDDEDDDEGGFTSYTSNNDSASSYETDNYSNQNSGLLNTKSSSSNYDFSGLVSKDKKIVNFVGTTKNGTSFIVNNVAHLLATRGIKTAILDMTKTRNAYYMYTNSDESLMKIASECIFKLRSGIAEGINVNKNLTVFTSVPEDDADYSDVNAILGTLVKNYSLVLIDCDFDTPMEYFAASQETYLVQSMDVLTMQPLTAFLRNLQSKGILKQEKLKVVINKGVNIRSVSIKTLIGGISKYNDPSMTYMKDLFDKDQVSYCVIPFETQNYIKYLDSVITCQINLNGYTKPFMNALNQLGNMIYPLLNTPSYSPRGDKYKDSFSSNINDTLNKMKRKYQ